MRYLLLLFSIIVGHCSFGQDNNMLQQKKYFDQELKLWKNTFSNFFLSDFQIEDTLCFDNNFPHDFNSYKSFQSTYRPIIAYTPDSSKFIDIYSYQLNLEEKGDFYKATPDIDQAIFLCDLLTNYWNRIFFGTSSQWIDEVIWTSKTKFILVGVFRMENNKKKPIILLGDTNKQTLIKYINTNKSTFQGDKSYSSPKLKRIRIEGL